MLTHLKVYNLSVQIETKDATLINLLEEFLAKYYTVAQGNFGGKSGEQEKVFVSKIENFPVWVLHRIQFAHFVHYLKECGHQLKDYTTEDLRDYKVITEDYRIRDTWKLRDDQVPVFDFLMDKPVGSKLVPVNTGVGKAQPLDSLIKVPGGWTKMGDIRVGDTVIAKDGSKTKVTGVYPQGKTPCYRLTFADGRTCIASDEHLWKVFLGSGDTEGRWSVLTTKELKYHTETTQSVAYIDLCDPELTDDVSLPVPPYLLGVTLRDSIYGRNNPEKSIPEEYLNASFEQKLELIIGLLGIDGESPGNDGSITFSTCSHSLAKQTQYLIRSIGGMATIVVKKQHYNVYIEYRKPNDLFISPGNKKQCIVPLKLRVNSVEGIGEMETQCISIDHPEKLYITDDFIVTHNTTIALFAIGKLGQRLGIVITPQFVDKWISDIQQIHDAGPKDVMVVQGSKAVARLVAMAKDNEITSKYFIFSSRTISDFISLYEENPELCVDMYGCEPAQLFPLLGIGVMLIDETHMAFHSIYKIIIHTNVKFQIGLSATLMSEDTTISRAHKIVYPTANTYGDQMIQRYIDIYAISYSIPEHHLRQIKTSNRGSSSYSHIAFEQSIMKKPNFFTDYVRIIVATIEDYFYADYKPNDKLIIFVATVEMATKLRAELETLYPSEKVVRYCEEDLYEDMLKGTIIVTTVISAGTGLDIPNLRVGIQTVSVSSPVSNIQTAGRLRKLKDRDVKFCYVYCPSIPKQRMYHNKRIEIFKNRAANYVFHRSRAGFR